VGAPDGKGGIVRHVGLGLKRAIDVLVSGVLMIVCAPVMAAISLAIKLDSRGPVIFSQQREGRRSDTFRIFKFRTMIVGADGGGAPTSLHDPKITRLGRWLRVNSLDELPQLLNVLRGDMSLVGPRPLLPGTTAPDESRRRDMRPGLTSLVEINEPHLLGWDERMQIDILYVDQWSLGLDLRILLKTIPVIFGRKDAVDPPRVGVEVSTGEVVGTGEAAHPPVPRLGEGGTT
jgi:lipopolysaccharide/colanic/teichoic acid biosynthesis glycosyltransferase